MKIKQGWGFWDLSRFPYGGDFKRAKEDMECSPVPGGVKLADEVRVKLSDGRIIITKEQAIEI